MFSQTILLGQFLGERSFLSHGISLQRELNDNTQLGNGVSSKELTDLTFTLKLLHKCDAGIGPQSIHETRKGMTKGAKTEFETRKRKSRSLCYDCWNVLVAYAMT